MNEIERFVDQLATIMWRGHHWEKTPRGPRMQKRALALADIERHAAGGAGVGLCPIAPGASVTRVALLDMDSHKGEVPWAEMIATAARVVYGARLRGLRPMAFRSSGGKGIHLLFTWQDEQDAASVRALLAEVLAGAGFKNGTKGVKLGEIEIFPKQDAVPADGYGSMFVLPFAGESVALDLENGLREMAVPPRLLVSDPVPHIERTDDVLGDVPDSSTVVPDLSTVGTALWKIDPRRLDYDGWRNVVFAWHSAGGDEATIQRWSEQNEEKHDARFLSEEVWPFIKDRPGGITAATIFAVARQQELPSDLMADFTDVRGEAPVDSGDTLPAPSAASPPTLSLTWTDIQGIDESPPAPIDWIVPGWVAKRTVTLLFARGGFGKSLIAQQLLTSVALGLPWLGLDVKRGTAMGIFTEEDESEQRRRQQRINARYGTPSAALTDLWLQARAGYNNVLMSFDERIGRRTKLLDAIEQEVGRKGVTLLVLDNVAQMFGGNENDRSEATQFVNALARIATRHDCAVVLVGHTGKAGESEYSGSTAWDNVGRSRLYLAREQDESLTLSVAKTNIGTRTSVALQWRDGVFEAFDRATQSTAKSDEFALRVLDAIRVSVAGDQMVSNVRSVSNYLPKVMVARGLAVDAERRALGDALDRMVALGVVKTDAVYGTYPGSGKQKHGLKVEEDHVLIPKPMIGQDSDDIL